MEIIEEGPLKVEQGAVSGGLEVTRRESNCLTAFKVLEMICDPFQVCALEGGARYILCERGIGQEREMTVANAHFLLPWGHA